MGKDDDGGTEIALSSFLGTCFMCKKKGHKANECPKKRGKVKNRDKTSETCGHCGKKGHSELSCWIKPENKDKAPEWIRKKIEKKETAATYVNTSSGGSNLEVMLCELSFVKDLKILLDPNVFIADSGASAHSTGSGIGTVDLQEGERNAGIMMPNGNIMKPSKTGKLPVVVCNKHAEELFNAVVEDFNIVSEQQFNLFSTTKLIKAGWIPGGNTEALWFTKGSTVIKFDIEIPTKNG
jgi:hypothetical protein